MIAGYWLLMLLVTCSGLMAMAQFAHGLTGGKLPWTSEPVVAGDSFRFVIVGDLTGGEQAGVFDMAIQRINELAPDFVITVGDLIEGYTFDTDLVNKQWDAVENSLSRLEAPFFLVGGNHDLTNEMMLGLWKERFGYDYYSFHVGRCLFVVLNTSEPGIHGFSEAQVNSIITVADDHPAGDPVFVFSHHPFWKLSEWDGYQQLDSLFLTKNTTWFCGHEHRYLHKVINKQPHYMLAGLASGGPGMRGPHLGEYHNLMMASVAGDRIRLANLDLKGLIPLDVVNDDNEKQVSLIRRPGSWARIHPTVVTHEVLTRLESELILCNHGDYPMAITGGFLPVQGYHFEPREIDVLLDPGKQTTIPLVLETHEFVVADDIPDIQMELHGQFLQGEGHIASVGRPVWTIDRLYHSSPLITPAGNYPQGFSKPLRPGVVEESWDWDGFGDAAFALKVMHDKKYVYIDVVTHDDQLVSAGEQHRSHDVLGIYINPDTIFSSNTYAHYIIKPGVEGVSVTGQTAAFRGVETNYHMNGNTTIHASIKVPRRILPGQFFRINVSYLDVDEPLNMDHARLWWKPPWDSSEDYPQSGVFLLNE